MKTPHPGAVGSDQQAFNQISARFQDEVGRILSHVDFEAGPVPFWALTRTMFPVADSSETPWGEGVRGADANRIVHNRFCMKTRGCKSSIWRALQDSNLRPHGS